MDKSHFASPQTNFAMQPDHRESEILHISSHKSQSKVSEVSVVHSISKTISVLLFVTKAEATAANHITGLYQCHLDQMYFKYFTLIVSGII